MELKSKRRRTLSVLVPAYNEALNLESAVRDILDAAVGFEAVEVVVVDDGSTDGTAQVADRLAQEIPQVVAIHHPHNRGIAAAYETGLEHAHHTYFAVLPGDHEVALESVRDILGAIGKADLVVPFHATPWKRAWHRRALTVICTTQLNVLFGWRLHYYQGPTVYPTVLARALPRTTRGFFFLTEMLVHSLAAGYSWTEVGLTHQERAYGRSKAVALANIVDAQKAVVRVWWRVRVRGQRVVPQAVADGSTTVLEGAQI